MNYPRNKKGNKKKKFLVIVGALLALIFLFVFKNEGVRRSVSPSAMSVYGFFRGVKEIGAGGLNQFFLIFREKRSLAEENRILREKITGFETDVLMKETLEKENSELRGLLSLNIKNKDALLTSVIRVSGDLFADDLMIEGGANRGIKEGMRVTAFNDVFLGAVKYAYEKTSLVELISFPGVQTSAVLEKSGIPVVLEGRGGGNLMISLPRSFNVEPGERVVTLNAPPFLVGVIESADRNNTRPLQKILLRIPVNLPDIKYVFLTEN